MMMKTFLSTILILSATVTLMAQAEWQIRNPMPNTAEPRHHPVAFAIDGNGYVFTGGSDTGTGYLNDGYKYNAATEEWTELEPFPGLARSFAYGLETNGKGYLGFGSGRTAAGVFTYLNDLWEFDPETESWKQLASCPCEARNHPAFVATSEKIFVGLGNGNLGNTRDWWEYDIATDVWTRKPNYPGARRHHPFFFAIDGLVYVAFGHGDNAIFNDLYVYDPATEEWEQKASLPAQARVAGTEFAYNGKGYVLSGDGQTHQNLPSGEMWSYDPTTDEWTEEVGHPGQGRWAPGSFVIGDEVYLTGGEFIILYNDLISFNLSDEFSSSEDETPESSLVIYPNPTSDLVYLSDITNIQAINIFDAKGRLVLTNSEITEPTITVSHLEAGSYNMELTTKDKSAKLTRKLVIQ